MNLSVWSSLSHGLESTLVIILKRGKFSWDLLQRYLLKDLSLGKPNQLMERHVYLNLTRSPEQSCEVSGVRFIDEEMEFERSKRKSQGLRVGIASYSTFYPLPTLDALIEKLCVWFLD